MTRQGLVLLVFIAAKRTKTSVRLSFASFSCWKSDENLGRLSFASFYGAKSDENLGRAQFCQFLLPEIGRKPRQGSVLPVFMAPNPTKTSAGFLWPEIGRKPRYCQKSDENFGRAQFCQFLWPESGRKPRQGSVLPVFIARHRTKTAARLSFSIFHCQLYRTRPR